MVMLVCVGSLSAELVLAARGGAVLRYVRARLCAPTQVQHIAELHVIKQREPCFSQTHAHMDSRKCVLGLCTYLSAKRYRKSSEPSAVDSLSSMTAVQEAAGLLPYNQRTSARISHDSIIIPSPGPEKVLAIRHAGAGHSALHGGAATIAEGLYAVLPPAGA